MDDLVSVVMPAYNAEKYIGESIESIISQTYSDLELIIVNDGSTDNTGDVILSYQYKYKDKIRYIDKKINEGTALTLNRAINEARGIYVCWLSADDLYTTDMIETQVKYLKNHKEIDIVFSDYQLIDQNSQFIQSSSLKRAILELKDKKLYQPYRGLLTLGLIIYGCSMMIPKTCYDNVGGFNPNYRYAHDYDMWLRLAEKFSIGYLDKINVKGRIYPEQISQQGHNEVDGIKVLLNFIKSREKCLSIFKKAQLPFDLNGILIIFEELLILFKHKEKEFNIFYQLSREYLVDFARIHNIKEGEVLNNKFIRMCELIKTNPEIYNRNFFSENASGNYLESLCNFLNLDGFIINKQGIRFDRFEGYDIRRLNNGLMRSNTIVIVKMSDVQLKSIVEKNAELLRYYVLDNFKHIQNIGISYYMLMDNEFKEILTGMKMEITDHDIWSVLMNVLIKEGY